jgi:hypothetical protein
MTMLEPDSDRVTRLAAAAGVVYTGGAESLAHDLRIAAGTATLAARDDEELTRLMKGLKPVTAPRQVVIKYPEINRGLTDAVREWLGALDTSTMSPAARVAIIRKAEREVAAKLAADNPPALTAPVGPTFSHLHGKDRIVAHRQYLDGVKALKEKQVLEANFPKLSPAAQDYAQMTLKALDVRIKKARLTG